MDFVVSHDPDYTMGIQVSLRSGSFSIFCVTITAEKLVPNNLPSLNGKSSIENTHGTLCSIVAGLLLMLMAILAGGSVLRESVTIDEVARCWRKLSAKSGFTAK